MTLKELAKLAGVSYSTVSKALNDSHEISEQTKTRIKALAKKYHYIPNASVYNLKFQKTYNLALIFSRNLMFNGDSIMLGSTLQQLLIHEIEKFGYTCTVHADKNPLGESMVPRICNQRIVDGFIFVSDEIEEEDMAYLKEQGIPFVFCMLAPKSLPDEVSYFLPDDFQDGYHCTNFLIQNGHRKIVTIANVEKYADYQLRTQGYYQAMAEHNLPPQLIQSNMNATDSERLIQENYQLISQADALFIQWDGMAGVIMQYLISQNIPIPQKVSIMGYNDYPITAFFRPMLTTMHDARELQCFRAIQALTTLINNPDAPVIRSKAPGKIILRESVLLTANNESPESLQVPGTHT